MRTREEIAAELKRVLGAKANEALVDYTDGLQGKSLAVIRNCLQTFLGDNVTEFMEWLFSQDEKAVEDDLSNAIAWTDTSHILSGIQSLRAGAFHDVRLTTMGQEFPCHRCILALHSTYFRSVFEGKFAESGHTVLEAQCSPEVLELLLDYMYTGSIRIPAHLCLAVVQDAEYLGIEPLRAKIVPHLVSRVCLDTVLIFLVHSLEWQHTELKAACVAYASENADLLLPLWRGLLVEEARRAPEEAGGEGGEEDEEGGGGVLQLGLEFVRDLLQGGELRADETDVLAFVLAWCEAVGARAGGSATEAAGEFARVADVVRFGLLTEGQIQQAVRACGVQVVSEQKAVQLRDRKALADNAKKRAPVYIRFEDPAPPGLRHDEGGLKVERVPGYNANFQLVSGDITALTRRVFAPNSGKHFFEAKLEACPRSQVFVGLWDADHCADRNTFANPHSYSLDLFSGQIFVGEECVPFLDERVRQGQRVGLLWDSGSGDVSVFVDGKSCGRAFTGVSRAVRFAVTLHTLGDLCSLTQAPVPS